METTKQTEERKAEEAALWQYWIVERHNTSQFDGEIDALNRGTPRTQRDGSHPSNWPTPAPAIWTDPRD